jgi:hypothetical protein
MRVAKVLENMCIKSACKKLAVIQRQSSPLWYTRDGWLAPQLLRTYSLICINVPGICRPSKTQNKKIIQLKIDIAVVKERNLSFWLKLTRSM